MLDLRNFAKTLAAGGLALFLFPVPNPIPGPALLLHAQAFPGRLRRPPALPETAPPAPAPETLPPAPAAPQAVAPQDQHSPGTPTILPPSLLQQPAQPAKIQFTANTLSIAADNSSLDEILRSVSSKSGMLVQGLGSDERVFGNFGPGNPRDVLDDLLNGTPYNIVMVGDLSSGAPRQLILSPVSQGAASIASPSPQPQAKEPDNDAEGIAAPPTPPIPRQQIPPGFNPQTIKTPQQLFQELQALRQQQQQQQGAGSR